VRNFYSSVLLHRFILSLLGVILTVSGIRAQYYPGGMSNSNLALWLTAADGTTLLKTGGGQAGSGNGIAQWSDKSGNNLHAIQITAANQPVLQTNALNGNSAVIFQNFGQLMTGPSGAYRTIVGVRSMPGAGHYQSFFASPANTDFSIRGGGAATVYSDGPNVNDWTVGTGATPTQWLNGVQTMNGSSANHILVSAAAAPTNATYSINSTFLNRGMNGNDAVYEIVAYGITLSTTQRRILENYEASAWGLQSLLPAAGYTIFTPPSTTTFNKNLVGIGYTSAIDNVLSTASSDGLGLSSTSGATGFLQTTGYVMAAHNGQANTILTGVSLPSISSASSMNRWNRSWYLSQSGGNSSGQVTLSFNFSNYNGSTVSGLPTYTLLYNATDGTFASGANNLVVSTQSVSASTVAFTVNATNLPNGYYTILYSNTPITLPLQLTDWTATPQKNSSLLRWGITQGNEASHFDIERTVDGSNYVTIGTVTASNGTASDDYVFTDDQPAAINFYRLKMVSNDGNAEYSPVRTVEFRSTATLSLYPNPATDILHITVEGSAGKIDVSLLDMQGRVVRRIQSGSASVVDLPVRDLAPGIYVAAITAGNQKFLKEWVKGLQ
jgi:hypothetical protein